MELFNRASILGLIGLGEGLVIMTGGIDLSVGAIVGLCISVMTILIKKGVDPLIIVIISIAVSGLCGLINGFIVGRTKIPPFAITLGTYLVFQSLALFIVGAGAEDMPQIVQLVKGQKIFTPILKYFPVLVLILFLIILGIIFFFTKFGVNVMAIGGNEKASIFLGIKTKDVKLICYLITGFFCGIAAFLLIYQVGGANPVAGQPYLLESIMAVVIGGVSLNGGKGNIFNIIIGAFVMVSLTNLLNILRVDPYIQEASKGMLLLVFIYIINAVLRYSEKNRRSIV
ncbi:MAG: ABC transporter permease [Actinobacteria bacterium]|nr:ABC transporter permease [Actinomycetota bacterium]